MKPGGFFTDTGACEECGFHMHAPTCAARTRAVKHVTEWLTPPRSYPKPNAATCLVCGGDPDVYLTGFGWACLPCARKRRDAAQPTNWRERAEAMGWEYWPGAGFCTANMENECQNYRRWKRVESKWLATRKGE